MRHCWLLVFVTLAAGCGSGSSYDRDAADLPAASAAAKSAGLPSAPNELDRKIPAGQNAALEYRQLAAIKLPTNLPWVGAGWDGVRKLSRAEIDTRNTALTKLSKGLELMIAASRKNHCDFERDWSLGPAVTFPELAGIKNWQKVLSAATIVAAAKGNVERVRLYTKAMFTMSAHLFEGDSLIDQLVGIAVARIACRACAQAISQATNPKLVASAVYEGMMPMSLRYDFARALRAEGVSLSYTYREIAKGMSLSQLLGESPGSDPEVLKMQKVDRKVLGKALEARMWRWNAKVLKVTKAGTTLEQARQIQELAKTENSPFLTAVWTQYAAAGVGYVSATSSLLLGAQIVASGQYGDPKWNATAKSIGLTLRQQGKGVWVEPRDVNLTDAPSNFKSLNSFRYPFAMPEKPVNK